MAAVVRLKRRLTDAPTDSLALCKRIRTESAVTVDTDNPATILTLAGTTDNRKTDELLQLVEHKLRDDPKLRSNRSMAAMTKRIRDEFITKSSENRFRVVDSFRATSFENSQGDTEITVLDVEQNVAGDDDDNDGAALDGDTPCVYDVYYAANAVQNVNHQPPIEEWEILPWEDRLGQPIEPEWDAMGSDDDGEELTDSEDSNAETHWRNDYPDEEDVRWDVNDDDDEYSVHEEDMIRAIQNVNIGHQLSSSGSEEAVDELVYGLDDEGWRDIEEGVNIINLDRLEADYARFTANAQNISNDTYDKDSTSTDDDTQSIDQ